MYIYKWTVPIFKAFYVKPDNVLEVLELPYLCKYPEVKIFCECKIWSSCSQQQDSEIEDVNRSVAAKIHLHTSPKNIVLHVYNVLTSENYGVKDKVIMRTSTLTGVPYSTVLKIVNYGVLDRKERTDKGKCIKIGSNQIDVIRRGLYEHIQEAIAATTPEVWKNSINHVIKLEEQYLEFSKTTPHLIIHVDSSEEAPTDSSDKDDYI
ncbi:hypothetical protein QE152_g29102 [Popillia japonica]|uniref:Uncharacterized protein n=1 Tax=Popillia japonica TaxID=7064 RepID=A0AAW1JHZ6_POPJA